MAESDKKVRKLIWAGLNKLNIGWALQLQLKSGLKDDGWIKSFKTKTAIDANGKPIPWNTYPFIKFIEPRLKKSFDVFEYGSGNSTLWYAERVNHITAVEHHEGWYNEIKNKMPRNVNLVFKKLENGGEYCRESGAHEKKFHIIIIDGRDRVNCIKNGIGNLTEDGIIVFDNSDLTEYADGIKFLTEHNFRRIDFIGLSPVTAHNNYTSIFYRTVNCLGI